MRALLSVYDKSGIVEFAIELAELGFEIISTGGTFSTLREAGLPVVAVADVTGFPEILDGRVKTLHPNIHGGLLARRDLAEHVIQLEKHGITPINLLAVNLYPFAETTRIPGISEAEAIEQIDIGGPAMLRAASKNFENVVVLTDPSDYSPTIEDLKRGTISIARRRGLAAKGFGHVAAYDTMVSSYLRDTDQLFPEELTFGGRKLQDLRYGENPQQRAAAYLRLTPGGQERGVLDAIQLSGKELSFNNLLDADAARTAIERFNAPTVAIVKHTIPCGVATRELLSDAFTMALEGDPMSAFGGIVALNRRVDSATAKAMSEVFFEVIIAPGFDSEAIDVLSWKKHLRLLELEHPPHAVAQATSLDVRPIVGGLLVQEQDGAIDDNANWKVVTKREPSDSELRDLKFAWEIGRHVKSNAIVLAKNEAVVGVGSGQPNRVESVCIAAKKAAARAKGAVLSSDAFFPFADGLEEAIRAGVTAAVQPGGSVRDEEVIAAADAANIAMMFTGVRHFKH
jgi:phosphoribosylaminoimidazolecarboxamide formyltransferase / IMP cyclohydrolase